MQVENKLNELRIKWKKYPELRDIIRCQVRAIKISQEPYKSKKQIEDAEFVSNVINNLT